MYIIVLALLFGIVATLLANDTSPDLKLLGRWEEVLWKYEKLDAPGGEISESTFQINDQVKQEISKGLVIHEAEIWEVEPDGKINLYKKNGKKDVLQWRLKGRGNILKLSGKDNSLEHYQIQKLTADTMEIHFNTDLQARGIIKMKFVKIENGK